MSGFRIYGRAAPFTTKLHWRGDTRDCVSYSATVSLPLFASGCGVVIDVLVRWCLDRRPNPFFFIMCYRRVSGTLQRTLGRRSTRARSHVAPESYLVIVGDLHGQLDDLRHIFQEHNYSNIQNIQNIQNI